MKKFIAISAALALVAGSAFAVDVTWGGEVTMGVHLLQGGNDYGATAFDDPAPGDTDPAFPSRSSNLIGRGMNSGGNINVTAVADTDIGRFQAWSRLNMGGDFDVHNGWRRVNPSIDAHIWWRPIDMFRMGIGNELGGLTGGIGVTGPQRVTGAGVTGRVDDGLGDALYQGRAFLGGFGNGLIFEVTPDLGDIGLNIAIGLPYHRADASNAVNPPDLDLSALDPDDGLPTTGDVQLVGNIFRGVFARVWVDLDGIGRIGFGYREGSQGVRRFPEGSNMPMVAETIGTNPGRIHAFFSSSQLVPGLGFQFGLGFRLPNSYEVNFADATPNLSWSGASELSFGLGVQYTDLPGLGLRFNASVALALGGEQHMYAGQPTGLFDTRASAMQNATRMSFQVGVDFEATETILLVLSGGFGLDIAGGDYYQSLVPGAPSIDVPNRVHWAVNPYVVVNFGGGPRFLAGFQIWGQSGDHHGAPLPSISTHQYRNQSTMNWAVPIGMVFSF